MPWFLDAIGWLDQHSGSLLAVITAAYATMTYLLLREAREGRRNQLLPKMQADLYGDSHEIRTLRIRNVGIGPALDARVDIHVDWGEIKNDRIWIEGSLMPGEERFLPLGLEDSWTGIVIGQKHDFDTGSVRLDGTFRDVYERKHNINQKIDVMEIIRSRRQSEVRETWGRDRIGG